MCDVKPAITCGDLLEHSDAMDAKLTAARAIIDCVRVLTALERMPMPNQEFIMGGGYAGGQRVRDESMPDALYHAMELIEEVQQSTSRILAQVRAGMKEGK